MKTAIFLHGMGGAPGDHWFPWLKRELEKEGWYVWAPELPESSKADLSIWVPFVLANAPWEEGETILVGHSAGAVLAMAVAEQAPVTIKRALLVAGFAKPLPNVQIPPQCRLAEPEWEKMKENCHHFVYVHSNNDPWGCGAEQGHYLQSMLGGTLVIESEGGHFGSIAFDQPLFEFPILQSLCLLP